MMFPQATLLIVDDDLYVRESLREILSDSGYAIEEAADGKIALDILAQRPVELMLLDLDLPRVSGMEVLRKVTSDFPEIGVVIISGKGTIQLAVEATKLGAYDFLEKPLESQRTLLTVRHAVEKFLLVRQRNRLLEETKARYRMVGAGAAMQRIYRLIDKAALSQSKVLILGENGTGKELIARAIHHNSVRSSEPFVTVNCAAIPENLIESELFGHQKGAFTGAYVSHKGKFEQANRGTLFLDEIGDASPLLQAKILRALEDGVIERVGGEQSIPIDVQVIAATNKDLHQQTIDGSFREDLYFRLNVIVIEAPPLRERREDIPLLIDFFMKQCIEQKRLLPKKLDHGVMKILTAHDWPGNVRELHNVIERMMVLSENEVITARDANIALHKNDPEPENTIFKPLLQAREQFERDYILKALVIQNWKIHETAVMLGIERSHLWKKMKQYHIEKPSTI